MNDFKSRDIYECESYDLIRMPQTHKYAVFWIFQFSVIQSRCFIEIRLLPVTLKPIRFQSDFSPYYMWIWEIILKTDLYQKANEMQYQGRI